MSIFSKLKLFWQENIGFDTNSVNEISLAQGLTGKEMQLKFIKEYLKPLLKQHGYSTKVQTWWCDRGDFFIIINLQNFSWNSRDDISFCFNIGVGLKAMMKDQKDSPGYRNLVGILRQDAYLTNPQKPNKHRNQTGYLIKTGDSFDNFVRVVKTDFENDILPVLSKWKTLKDCVDYYENKPFWGDNLKMVIIENNIPFHK